MSSPAAAPWRSRITGEGDEDPTQLLANPRNWRTHPGRQRDAMRGALHEVGWVQRIIVNTTTGHVVDGHLRVEEAISAGAPTVPVLYVELSEEEEAKVLATLDPLGAMAGKNDEALMQLLKEVRVEAPGLADLLARLARDPRDTYARTVNSPRYEPAETSPELAALRDETKAEQLRQAIREAELEPELAAFLHAAAARHVIFDYARIADYYASAPAPVQRLMEQSALVILDFADAIRDGYVRFTDAMAQLAEEAEEDG